MPGAWAGTKRQLKSSGRRRRQQWKHRTRGCGLQAATLVHNPCMPTRRRAIGEEMKADGMATTILCAPSQSSRGAQSSLMSAIRCIGVAGQGESRRRQ